MEPCDSKINGASVERRLGVDDAGSGSMSAHTVGRRILALRHRLGEHDGDRLTDEAHPAVGQRRADEVGMHGDEAVVRGDAERLGGEDGDDAGHLDRIVDVDGAEHAMGHVGADEHGVETVDERQVGEVLPGTDEQPRVLGAGHPRAEDRTRTGCGGGHVIGDGHHRRTYRSCAARCRPTPRRPETAFSVDGDDEHGVAGRTVRVRVIRVRHGVRGSGRVGREAPLGGAHEPEAAEVAAPVRWSWE